MENRQRTEAEQNANSMALGASATFLSIGFIAAMVGTVMTIGVGPMLMIGGTCLIIVGIFFFLVYVTLP